MSPQVQLAVKPRIRMEIESELHKPLTKGFEPLIVKKAIIIHSSPIWGDRSKEGGTGAYPADIGPGHSKLNKGGHHFDMAYRVPRETDRHTVTARKTHRAGIYSFANSVSHQPCQVVVSTLIVSWSPAELLCHQRSNHAALHKQSQNVLPIRIRKGHPH